MDENIEQVEQENLTDNKTKKAPYFILGMCVGLLVGLIALVAYAVLGLVGFTANGGISFGKGKVTHEVLNSDVEKKVHLLEEFIDKYYLEEPDNAEMVDGMYKGLVAGLGDPYSTYYNEEELEKINQDNKGTFYGIGVVLTQNPDTKYISVVEVMDDAPATGSGIEPDDVLYAVDDEVVLDQDLAEVIVKIKGEKGTKVKITMYRNGEYMDYELVRDEVKTETVVFKMLDDDIGYIGITQFDQVTYKQFEDALKEGEEKDMKGLVIDLRGNPGGDLQTVVKMADLLLPQGLVVYTEDKEGVRKEFTSDGERQFTKPLAVLVNKNSASASEILAGAIKDYGIGTIVGTQTFGKGIVQRILSLGDGTAIKLTISKYYTPKGNNIHGVGIEPDVEVELDTKKYLEEGIDDQLKKAEEIVRGKIDANKG